MGASSAIICFNDGGQCILNVFTKSGVEPGYFAKEYCENEDNERIRVMNYKSAEAQLLSRKSLRNT